MGDWLGTGRISSRKRVYLPYAEAHAFVRKLGLNNIKEWREWAKSTRRPDNIPMTPQTVYKDKGWISYGDWLGNGKGAREF